MEKNSGSGGETQVTEKQIRHYSLAVMVLVFFVGYIFTERYDRLWTGTDYDTCLYVYGANTVMTLLCAVLYTVHWFRVKAASEVFAFVTLLFYSMTLDYGMQFFVRYRATCATSYYLIPLDTWWWELRSFPRLVICTYMLILIISRMLESRRG